MWLCDTGCPYDLTSRGGITPEMGDLESADVPTTLETANGMIEVDETVPVQILALRENIDPYVMEESPDVLSIGRRCEVEGYEFHWPAYSAEPYFVDKTGKHVTLRSIHHVPYLVDNHNIGDVPLLGRVSCAAFVRYGTPCWRS